ncbi:hypothetical protein [Blastococcus sp. TF02A-26]|uniref:hypothetical protein n=1 Tax=Blastococcus sp. TF02A-26 TaxID=2250577 RepID=UPI000DEA4113|nr:hypothetical protein [Blastococcus sp. TF02A-26]RBY86796.1 hypothetical protein DQ240_08275 [Blastococcus sp. TF02A-26]
MLALTPEPLRTAGERAVFAELARWDTGGTVRSAIVASLPLVDGPMGRRISDAVLFVPEGLAVVRIAEVPKQRGIVTAVPEGAWSIAPDGGPGEVLQIAGGGSSPLDGLMRAGMDAALKLRQAGLEPGRIARLTVLVGDVTGLRPEDGDLGEGDQVALLDTRSLLLGIARAAHYTGVANPRYWTTADVRTALEVLGLPGRGPSVEELNGEGFPYSPYVLRRRELLTPAAMNAASAAEHAPPVAPPAPAAPPVVPPAIPAPAVPPVTGGFVAPHPDGPRIDPAAAAAVAAAAIRADEAAAAAQQHAATAPAPSAPAPRPPVQQAPAPVAPAPVARDETDGIGGLFGAADSTDPGAPAQPPTLVAPTVPTATRWERPPGMPLVVARRRPDRTRRLALAAAAAVLVVVLLVVAISLLTGGDDDGGSGSADPSPTTAAPSAAGPSAGEQTPLDDLTFTAQVVQQDDTCADHAYGDVADFFAAGDCAGLARALYSTEVDGQPVVVSIATVDMGDAARAGELKTLVDTDGSGNVNDLLREGESYPGAPARLTGAQYASSPAQGGEVTIVETAWAGPGSGSAQDLDRVAGLALALEMPDPTP